MALSKPCSPNLRNAFQELELEIQLQEPIGGLPADENPVKKHLTEDVICLPKLPLKVVNGNLALENDEYQHQYNEEVFQNRRQKFAAIINQDRAVNNREDEKGPMFELADIPKHLDGNENKEQGLGVDLAKDENKTKEDKNAFNKEFEQDCSKERNDENCENKKSVTGKSKNSAKKGSKREEKKFVLNENRNNSDDSAMIKQQLQGNSSHAMIKGENDVLPKSILKEPLHNNNNNSKKASKCFVVQCIAKKDSSEDMKAVIRLDAKTQDTNKTVEKTDAKEIKKTEFAPNVKEPNILQNESAVIPQASPQVSENHGRDSIKFNERNRHPLFIAANGEVFKLLAKDKKVMKLTKPSPYETFTNTCSNLRRYFGGIPADYQCSKHKEENRPPYEVQQELYDYRIGIMTLMSPDGDEEGTLKHLKGSSDAPEAAKVKAEMAKICRVCGHFCDKFVSSGYNVIVKLGAVYLPIVIKEGKPFPLGICDHCDHSLGLLCSFVVSFLDGEPMGPSERKCFTCATETDLIPADILTMRVLALSLHLIRSELSEFFMGGQRYLCTSCRVSLKLFETLREKIWMTNEIFEREDEILYQVDPNREECELPPELLNRPKKPYKKSSNSIDNCSIEPTIDNASTYRDALVPRKFCVGNKERRTIKRLFAKATSFIKKSNKTSVVDPERSEDQEDQEKGKFLKCKVNPLQYLRILFRNCSKKDFEEFDANDQTEQKNEMFKANSPFAENENDDCESEKTTSISIEEEEKQFNPRNLLPTSILNNDLSYSDSDEEQPSLLRYFLNGQESSLFAYLNAEVPPVLDPLGGINSFEPRPSTSGMSRNLTVTTAEIHTERLASKAPSTPKVIKSFKKVEPLPLEILEKITVL